MPSMEPTLVASFEIRFQQYTSFIRICYPYHLLDQMLGQTGLQHWMAGAVSEVSPNVRARYEDSLRAVNVELRAELGRTTLSLRDLVALQEGDVIPLQRRTNEALRVFVDSHEAFSAAAGRAGKQRALRIVDLVAPPALPDSSDTDGR